VKCNFYYYRYDVSELPYTADGLKSWLNDIWRQKENRLADFAATSSFISSNEVPVSDNKHIDNALYLALVFWILVQVLKLILFNFTVY